VKYTKVPDIERIETLVIPSFSGPTDQAHSRQPKTKLRLCEERKPSRDR
jgi:hypothetical protein